MAGICLQDGCVPECYYCSFLMTTQLQQASTVSWEYGDPWELGTFKSKGMGTPLSSRVRARGPQNFMTPVQSNPTRAYSV